MRLGAVIALLAALVAMPAMAMAKPSTAERAVPGAGWSAVPVSGHGGKALYERYCVVCHGAGPDRPGSMALQVKYKGAVPAELEKRTDLTEAFVIFTVRHGVSVMPAARETEISDVELKAIAAYLAHKKD